MSSLQLQNDIAQLRCISTQRSLYSRAKALLGIQVACLLVAQVIGAIVVVIWPEVRPYTALYAGCVFVFDLLFWEPAQKRLRANAARIQERFDTTVFGIPWSSFLIQQQPDEELIHQWGAADETIRSDPTLTNWYAVELLRLPIERGRLIAQYINVSFTLLNRHRVSGWLMVWAGASSVIIVALSAMSGVTLLGFVTYVVTPLLPILGWAIRQRTRHIESISNLDRLKRSIDTTIRQVIAGVLPPEQALLQARQIQDQIVLRRLNDVPVPDWLYWKNRAKDEETVRRAVTEYVRLSDHHPVVP